jgi:hypothetical protein
VIAKRELGELSRELHDRTCSITDEPAKDRVNCKNGFSLASITSSSNAVTLLGSSAIGVSWTALDPAGDGGLGVVGDGAP